ncbi:exported hypothetical protein [Candidatus Sulfopaludibacter sp. SbA4]|nr:exported hypothetical protein [Candidatus Sulfopaludibacter sp. SbA4]
MQLFILGILLAAGAAYSQTLNLATNAPTVAQFGGTVTLTATVTPAGATGKVTFYDGTTILGIGTLSGCGIAFDGLAACRQSEAEGVLWRR